MSRDEAEALLAAEKKRQWRIHKPYTADAIKLHDAAIAALMKCELPPSGARSA